MYQTCSFFSVADCLLLGLALVNIQLVNRFTILQTAGDVLACLFDISSVVDILPVARRK